MSDLKLVAPDQPTPFERMLMDAARNEGPSAEQRMRVREALGLAAIAVVPPVVPPQTAARAGTAGKIAIGGVVGGAVLAALMFSGMLHKSPASAPVPSAVVTHPPVIAAAPTLVAAPAPEPVISPLPPVESPRATVAPGAKLGGVKASLVSSAEKSPAPADSVEDLSEQLRLIDSARSAVASGNASAASQALTSYSSRFPHGSFGQEAQVLHIETVDMQGNHAQAAALAKNFLAQHPNSPHVSLVQRIAGAGE